MSPCDTQYADTLEYVSEVSVELLSGMEYIAVFGDLPCETLGLMNVAGDNSPLLAVDIIGRISTVESKGSGIQGLLVAETCPDWV